MNEYKIIKSCFLGHAKNVIKLNPRQAANMLAGGYVERFKQATPVKKGTKK